MLTMNRYLVDMNVFLINKLIFFSDLPATKVILNGIQEDLSFTPHSIEVLYLDILIPGVFGVSINFVITI